MAATVYFFLTLKFPTISSLQIHLTFSLCFQFTVAIRVTVQKRLNIQLKLTGNVAFPQLKLHPSFINLRRLSASAYQHCLITASNVGSTMLKLRFQLKEYPEFRVSLSSRRQDPGIGLFQLYSNRFLATIYHSCLLKSLFIIY